MGGFGGFPADGLAFLAGLAADNSKAYFDAHRARYERAVRQPLEDLVGEAEELYGPGKVFRPNRDVRFSKDKSPYKTQAGGYAQAGHCVYYVALDADGLWVGGGMYHPPRELLAAARHVIAEDAGTAEAFRRALAEVQAAGLELAPGALRTAPRGYPRDHPYIAELRMTSYAALRQLPPGPEVHDADACRAAVFSVWAALAPLAGWLDEHLGVAAPEG